MKWLLVLLVACGDNTDALTLQLENGTIHGVVAGDTRAFLGIPYAAPPIGELRWKPPQPALPIEGVHDASHVGEQCPQALSLTGVGAEDCLFLNVWVPQRGRELPVMVWLHGGAFLFGSGGDAYYDGRYLAETYGVVVVTLNYRLGAFGFLAHAQLTAEDPAYPSSGNYGLEDQRAALQWVQRNISVFGGDPAQVTLFGESAGGFSTCVHYAFPRGEQLFRAAISESGLCASTIPEPSLAQAELAGARIAERLGCTGSDAIGCLRDKTDDELREATKVPPRSEQDPGGPFYADERTMVSTLPNVDGLVLPITLREVFAAGDFEPRPLLLGTNRDEGTLFHSVFFAATVQGEQDYRDAVARRFGAANVDAIVAQYPVASFANANRALAEVTGDSFFACPARRTARGVAAAGAATYVYSFERALDDPFLDDLGVFHSSELPFLFNAPPEAFPLGKVGSGQAVADAMQRYWTSFAITGSPDGDVAWPEYDLATDQHLILDSTITTGTGLYAERCVLGCDLDRALVLSDRPTAITMPMNTPTTPPAIAPATPPINPP